MTFDDDYILLHTESFGRPMISLVNAGLTWPPPELLVMDIGDGPALREPTKDDDRETIFERKRFSSITDEQRGQMTHVVRGAEYRYLIPPGQTASSNT